MAAAYVALCGGLPLVGLVMISVWRSLLEARYAGVVWGPLFALVAIGIASMSRTWVKAVLAALLVGPTVGFSLLITHPDTPALIAYIAPRLQPNDFIDAAPATISFCSITATRIFAPTRTSWPTARPGSGAQPRTRRTR